ncbi:MAG: phosphatase PAP2 family protein [Rhodomicrobium sp.]
MSVERGGLGRAVFIYCMILALVPLTYFYADRQLAEALRPHLSGDKFFTWLPHLVDPLGPLASIGVAIVAVRALARGFLTPAESAILRLSCAILIAWALKEELKWVFGRTWPETWLKGNPNPSYFGNGTYGFFPFHGGPGYASFPSGHTTAMSALAGAVWFLWPKLRWLGVALVMAVVIGLLGADYHWLSDIVAGAILGGATGAAAAHLGRHDTGA